MNAHHSAADFGCRRLRPMLGTFVAIDCRAADQATADRAVEAAFAAIRRVDAQMHPTRAGSDIAMLCAAPVGQAVFVHAWTWQVLDAAQRLHEQSRGVFDPCLPEQPGTIDDLRLPDVGRAVCTAPMAIDLGGIAKGFAVDRALDALRAAGCSAGLVNAGGDMRVYGADGVSVWVRTRTGARSITLVEQACAVSDVGDERRPSEHRGYYCRAVRTQPDLAASQPAVVLAPTAAVADALTKCVLLLRATNQQRTLAELLANFGATAL